MKRSAEPWERSLREGLDALAGTVAEESPPDLGAFIMLVSDVQREQRRALRRDLVRFLTAAGLILCAWLWAWLQFPVYFLMAQGAMAFAMAAAVAWAAAGGRRASHE